MKINNPLIPKIGLIFIGLIVLLSLIVFANKVVDLFSNYLGIQSTKTINENINHNKKVMKKVTEANEVSVKLILKQHAIAEQQKDKLKKEIKKTKQTTNRLINKLDTIKPLKISDINVTKEQPKKIEYSKKIKHKIIKYKNKTVDDNIKYVKHIVKSKPKIKRQIKKIDITKTKEYRQAGEVIIDVLNQAYLNAIN